MMCLLDVLSSTKEIRRFCKEDAELPQSIAYLMSIPGIGWASQLLARMGDWHQIDNVRQLGSFLGLVPTENSTGDTVDRGSINRVGDARLRRTLIQAAWSAIRQDESLENFIVRFARETPVQRARITIVASGAQTEYADLCGVEKPTTVHC
jgi:transposase